ncbi:MAG TPA: STAS/SEC14 domain-containing protein [Gammaproteobacteria bacterium]|nr:STAS/SEC14 domain-containing protein [Gammaproteobacteria bacterium]
MSTIRHGLSIGIERINNEFFLSLKAIGKLTHQDYEKINPMIDSALEGVKDPKVKVFIDGSELEGWELRAAWDDFKLGLKHGSEFDRIAIFGNKKWQEYSAKIGSWFISGEVRYFEDADEALDWLQVCGE